MNGDSAVMALLLVLAIALAGAGIWALAGLLW